MRRDLSRPNLETKIQEDFIAFGGATLEKLDDYIQHCEAVIHICGDMTGAMANEISIKYINDKYKDFGTKVPGAQAVLNGSDQISYTQWEAWLAIYHNKRLFVATPVDIATRDSRYIKDPAQIAQQLAHLKQLREKGYYDEIKFSDEDELIKKLYQSKLGDILNSIASNKPVYLPYQSIGTAFKGRDNFIKELFATFTATTNSVSGIAIHALGGMGKTRLAVEYALQHKKNYYTALFFVSAASPQILITNIANLSAPGILNLREYLAPDEGEKYAAVIRWLNQYSGWLLILDNVDTPEAAEKVEAVFAQLQQGHVLITTRIDTWSQEIKKKRLDVLHKEDAIAFLLETTEDGREKTGDDDKMAGVIAEELGCLALALEQSRAYIVTQEFSFKKYYKKWETNKADVLAWLDKQQMKYPASVATTWQTSFNQLSPAAVTLLNNLSWLSTDRIPKTLLDVEVPDATKIDAISAWGELKQYSLAASSDDRKTFTVHKLVQDITRHKIDKNTRVQTLTETVKWLDKAFTGDPDEVSDWPVLEPLVPHVLTLIDYTKKYEIDHSTSFLQNRVGLLFLNKAQYNEAEPLMRRALEIDEQNLGPSHPDVAIHLNNLGQLLQETNRLPKAEPLMRRALQIDEQNFGSDHTRVAIRLNNLAQLLKDTNRKPEAEPLMRRALQIDEQNFGSDHPNVARHLSNLGQFLKNTNRLQEAEPLMRRALEIEEQSFGSNHSYVAIDLNNLAMLLQETKRSQEAEPLMKRALEIDEKNFGPNHPRVARALNNLATLLQETKRLLEADPLMKRALIIFLISLGAEHPNTQTVGNNYVLLLKEMDKSEDEISIIFENIVRECDGFGK
ncbi:MAG: tetratricopeptide repeat protein [Bacteroidota bacterium]